jgi:hypothetical protein
MIYWINSSISWLLKKDSTTAHTANTTMVAIWEVFEDWIIYLWDAMWGLFASRRGSLWKPVIKHGKFVLYFAVFLQMSAYTETDMRESANNSTFAGTVVAENRTNRSTLQFPLPLKTPYNNAISATFVYFCFVYTCVKHVILKFVLSMLFWNSRTLGKQNWIQYWLWLFRNVLIIHATSPLHYHCILFLLFSDWFWQLYDNPTYHYVLISLPNFQHLSYLSAIHNTFLTISLVLMCTWHN